MMSRERTEIPAANSTDMLTILKEMYYFQLS